MDLNNDIILSAFVERKGCLRRCNHVQGPETNIDASKHPNLAEAQHQIAAACQKIDAAQQANKDELGGYGEKAKELLAQASRELKEAAEYANQRHH